MLRKSLLLLIAVLLLVLPLSSCEKSRPNGGISDASSSEEEPVIRPDYILYPGFSEQVFTENAHDFVMTNDPANKVDFRFRLIDNGGTVLFESENVAPGDSVRWDVTQRWRDGRHRLVIEMTPVSGDGTKGNILQQGIAVEIKLKK